MKYYWEKLKKRWGIESNGQVVIILIVFTLTGFTTLYIHQLIDKLLGIDQDGPFIYKVLVFLVIVLPVYNILLLIYGFLLGQYAFFKNFIIRFFSRLFTCKRK